MTNSTEHSLDSNKLTRDSVRDTILEHLVYVDIVAEHFSFPIVVDKDVLAKLEEAVTKTDLLPMTVEGHSFQLLEEHYIRVLEKYRIVLNSQILALRIFPETKIIPEDADPKNHGLGLNVFAQQGVNNGSK